jgi:hypothetical protein
VLRRTNQGRSAALTKSYANNSARWLDTSEDTSDASRKYRKAHADSNAGTGEVYRRESDPAPRCTSPRNYRVCTSSGKARADEQRAVALPQSVRRHLAKDAGAVGEDTCKSTNKN